MAEEQSSQSDQNQITDSTQKGHGNLTFFILGAIVLAILLALLIPSFCAKETALSIFHGLEVGGEVFLRALMMMVVPLVVASVMNGILGLGQCHRFVQA